MIGRLAALIFQTTLLLIQAEEILPQISLTAAELGDNLTLTCPVYGPEYPLIYWYKLGFGYMFETVAVGSFDKITLKGKFNNSRFTFAKGNTQYFLYIRNVSKEDEATYFCQAGSAYVINFITGTLVTVNDHRNQQKSFQVKQSPETESVWLGDSMILQCSLLSKNKENSVQCPGEHSVYWFRDVSPQDSHPGIIYTEKTRSDEEEERSCVYTLSKTIQDSSDTGTYYCAVVTCGKILFGEGTKVGISMFCFKHLYVLFRVLSKYC
ncbi:hypothetical protein PAMA_017099 [Pampus argenteus]